MAQGCCPNREGATALARSRAVQSRVSAGADSFPFIPPTLVQLRANSYSRLSRAPGTFPPVFLFL